MPVKKEPWSQGTPAWVDLMASDVEAAKAFYGELFGWEFTEGSEEFGDYSNALLGGDPVAGLGPAQGPESPPPAWTTYLAADDAEAVAATISEAGGTIVMPAMQVGDFGTMVIAADPTGAFFGLWQSGTHTGVDRYDEPGALVWNEVMVGDYQAGKDFYGQVFGYSFSEIGDEASPYATIDLDGHPVGGIGPVSLMGEGVPPHWRTYFAVADAAVTCAKATELGGSVVMEPFETPFGIMAGITGPGGEVFMINEPPSEQ